MEQPIVMPAVKNLNRVFIFTTAIGAFATIADIIVMNINIHPISTKAWLACAFMSTCLIALFILGVCTTIDQYLRLGYPFKDSMFELKKYIWILWFVFGALINLTLIAAASILMVELTTHHLASLPTHHSTLIGWAAMAVAVACFLHAVFTLFSLVIRCEPRRAERG